MVSFNDWRLEPLCLLGLQFVHRGGHLLFRDKLNDRTSSLGPVPGDPFVVIAEIALS